MINKLALGTVQFGLDYGVSNRTGKISPEEIKKILSICIDQGICMLDTASSYGDSEEQIGIAKTNLGEKFQIVTKLTYDVNNVLEQVSKSLDLLQVDSLYGVLFHSFQSLKNSPQFVDDLLSLKELGKVSKIGVSLYYPEEAAFILEHELPFDIIQLPYSLLDQRFEKILPHLKNNGIEIHSRSVFLQGLFFIDPDTLSKHFKSAIAKLKRFEEISTYTQIDKSHLALNFALLNSCIDKVVVGVENAQNLSDNIQCLEYLEKTKSVYKDLQEFNLDDLMVILPMNWK